MKRLLKFLLLVVVVLVVAAAALIGWAFLGRQSITDGAEVGDVRIVKDGIVSIGVVPLGPGQLALIDAGTDKSVQAIMAELLRRELDKNAVIAIFVTHGHPDHTASIPLFPNAQVFALEREAALIEGREGSHGPLTRFFPVQPTGITVAHSLQDGDTVTVGSMNTKVKVYAVPGHTQGSAAYLVKSVLFMGDAADASNDGTVIASPWIFSDSQAQDRASLISLEERLRKEDPEIKAIAFAHSGLLTEGLAALTSFAQTSQAK